MRRGPEDRRDRHARRRRGAAWTVALGLVIGLAGCTDPLGVDGPVEFVAVDAGGAHTCGISDEGTVYCWGRGEEGQLGNGGVTGSPVPVRFSGRLRYQAISAGEYHTCAATEAGDAYCWGWNFYGQLGVGTTFDFGNPGPVLGEMRFASLAAGSYHTCGRAAGREIYCWGNNVYGQLGHGSTATQSAAPVRVEGGHEFVAVTAGQAHSCGLSADGRAYCWGSNHYGQLGDGTTDDARRPVPVAGGHRFAAIDAGGTHTCATTEAGKAYCWGSNSHGELGIDAIRRPGIPGATEPVEVVTRTRFADLDAGWSYTCGLNRSDDPRCWGWGIHGQLGDALIEPDTPRKIFTVERTGFATLTTGRTHTCALTRSRVVYCWGSGQQGQLGHASITFSPSPVRVEVPVGG